MAELNHLWRVLATGYCFMLFGVGGILMTLLVFPVFNLVPASPHERRLRARRFIGRCFRLFLDHVAFLGVGRVSVEGAEHLARVDGMLVLANHPTLLDVVVHVALLPTADCVVKQELWRNPALGGVVRAAGYLSNDGSAQLADDCVAVLAAGRALIIYPEGTRSEVDHQAPFRHGAARIALRSGAPLLPLVMSCEPPTLMRGRPWYAVPHRAWHIKVRVLAPRQLDAMIDASPAPESLRVRRLTRSLEELFTKETGSHARPASRTQAADHRFA